MTEKICYDSPIPAQRCFQNIKKFEETVRGNWKIPYAEAIYDIFVMKLRKDRPDIGPVTLRIFIKKLGKYG